MSPTVVIEVNGTVRFSLPSIKFTVYVLPAMVMFTSPVMVVFPSAPTTLMSIVTFPTVLFSIVTVVVVFILSTTNVVLFVDDLINTFALSVSTSLNSAVTLLTPTISVMYSCEYPSSVSSTSTGDSSFTVRYTCPSVISLPIPSYTCPVIVTF